MLIGAHTVLYSSDAGATRDFLQNVLDLPSVDAGGGWLVFALPPAEVAVHPHDGPGHHELFLMCDDIDATVARLQARGAVISGPVSRQRWGLLTTLQVPGGVELGLYQPLHPTAVDPAEGRDRAAVAEVIRTFFAAFASGPGMVERLDALRRLFLPEAVIVRTGGEDPVAYDVDGFIAPRQLLLAGGELADFREWELSGRTELFGDVAAHVCRYAKTGTRNGTAFTGRGMKSLQLVRTGAGWRISALAWDDERDGVSFAPE